MRNVTGRLSCKQESVRYPMAGPPFGRATAHRRPAADGDLLQPTRPVL